MVTVDLQKRYQQERERRINVKGMSQYLDNSEGSLYALNVDPWIDSGASIQQPVPDGGQCKIVIFGAGFGGLCAAVRCLQRGVAKTVDDILIVDPAGGFGGTWWWNRFPGIMCDIESYIYLPLLEETGYMPKRKYASGQEIREYADLLADKYHLRDRAMFQSSGKTLTWETDHWACQVVQKMKGQSEKQVTINADFVILASGTFTYPKLPNLPGLGKFAGKMIHTARWDYGVTGGSQADAALTKLSGKKVALIGTGATAIQVVPEVAKYAGELFVFQRTPSAVDFRGNRNTDEVEWKSKIASKRGWQNERAENFQAFTENAEPKPAENLVQDGWTTMPTISGAYGGPSPYSVEEIGKFIEEMEALDAVRSEKVRQRAADTVDDPETAKNLQAWYPGWCKRPCFHDEYLPAFNLPGVHLIDTEGKGVEDLTTNSVVAGGKEYPVDIIIWSTGYGSPVAESLAGKAEMAVIGKAGTDMEKQFKQGDWQSLHGVIGVGYPNLFSLGLAQAGVGGNQTQRLDMMSEHVAYIITEAQRQVNTDKFVIEPTEEICKQWGDRIAASAYLFANMVSCTPSYFTAEAEIDRLTPEQQAKGARSSLFGRGFAAYSKLVKDWEEAGDMEGLNVTAL